MNIDPNRTLSEKIDTSLEIIDNVYKQATESETPLFVNFSGGKDSSTVLLLAKEIAGENVEAIYMSTRIELPNTIEFVKQEAERLNVKLHVTDPVDHYMGDFAWWVRHYGYFPAHGYNFCNSRLKIRASRRYLRGIHGHKKMFRLNGVRQQESTRRSKMYKNTEPIVKDGDLSGSYMVYPILEWTGPDVREFLALNKFEAHKQYAEFGISGCSYCPFYQKEIYYRILNRYPNMYDNIIALEEETGKPSVQGNVFMKDLVQYFMDNKEEIVAKLGEPKEKTGRCKTAC